MRMPCFAGCGGIPRQPVSDADRAKAFYARLGWRLAVDFQYLVVTDIEAARDALVARGVEVSEVFHPVTPGAQFELGDASGRASGPAPDRESYGSFATFSDPDGNGWLLQEITTRLPGHVEATETAQPPQDPCT
jgi:catechol 2,3-dioxygenase-like lactoylglutathione lyase family enzyme